MVLRAPLRRKRYANRNPERPEPFGIQSRMLFRRGIYQCIKYKAVLDAQILEQSIPVHSLLVTEEELDGELKQLAKKMKVKYLVISPEQ